MDTTMPSSPESESAGQSNPTSFDERKKKIVEKMNQLSNEAQTIWNLLANDQQLCSTLILKQVFVSDRYSDFHEIWRNIDFQGNVHNYLQFGEINERMNQMNESLTTFENKTQKTNTILTELRDCFVTRTRELNLALAECMACKEIEELENLRIPDFSRIQTNNAYCDLIELNQEWEDFDFHSKLDACFEALEDLDF